MRATGAAVAAVLLSLCAACGGGDGAASNHQSEPAQVTSTPSATVTPDASYATVEDLRDAAVKAGYQCARWKTDNKVKLAAESGHCDATDVFSTFASPGDLQSQLDSYKSTDSMLINAGVDKATVGAHLVGPNWIITSPQAAAIASVLGGTLLIPKP